MFSLGWDLPPFGAAFSGDPTRRPGERRAGFPGGVHGAVTLFGGPFEVTWPPDANPVRAPVGGPHFDETPPRWGRRFGSSFALFVRHYWGHPCWFLFLRLVICLSSAGGLARSDVARYDCKSSRAGRTPDPFRRARPVGLPPRVRVVRDDDDVRRRCGPDPSSRIRRVEGWPRGGSTGPPSPLCGRRFEGIPPCRARFARGGATKIPIPTFREVPGRSKLVGDARTDAFRGMAPGRTTRSKVRRVAGPCGSRELSHLAAFFVDRGTKVSVAEGHLTFVVRHRRFNDVRPTRSARRMGGRAGARTA